MKTTLSSSTLLLIFLILWPIVASAQIELLKKIDTSKELSSNPSILSISKKKLSSQANSRTKAKFSLPDMSAEWTHFCAVIKEVDDFDLYINGELIAAEFDGGEGTVSSLISRMPRPRSELLWKMEPFSTTRRC